MRTLMIGWAAAWMGCGGSAQYSSPSDVDRSSMRDVADGRVATSGAEAPVEAPASVDYAEAMEEDDSPDFGGGEDYDFDDGGGDEGGGPPGAPASDVLPPPAPPPAQYAQATPPRAPVATGTTPPAQASDAVDTSGPLLIYTAEIVLSVYEVEETQDRIISLVREAGGFLSHRTGVFLVVRVPAARFNDVITGVEGAGDVLSRDIQAQDVGEEFRDVEIRLRNAISMRDRLEALLARAENMESALAIEREIQRLTEVIEQLRGRQRFLSDRIAYSTITVRFQPRHTVEPTTGPDGFILPFSWLDEIGLTNLMRLR